MKSNSPFLATALVFALLAPTACAETPQVASGRIERLEVFPSEHVPSRFIDVWLPSTYDGDKPHAVLYMHDGAMLFDASTTWNGQEWGVDEVAAELLRKERVRPFIVVAVPNAGDERHVEFFPQKPFAAMSQTTQRRFYALGRDTDSSLFASQIRSDRYLKFLVEELKPAIDKRYAVLTGPEDTFVMGSSMGGLISLYAISEYPEVFGGAACLSTHWPGVFSLENNPFPDRLLAYLESSMPAPQNHKLYFDHGTAGLDGMYGVVQADVDQLLGGAGYDETSLQSRVFEGAEHNEDAWHERLHLPLLFLLGTDRND